MAWSPGIAQFNLHNRRFRSQARRTRHFTIRPLNRRVSYQVSYSQAAWPSACFYAKARLMRVTSQQEDKQTWENCVWVAEKRKIWNVERFRRSQNVWEIIVSNSKRKISSSSLRKTTSLTRNRPKQCSIKMRRWFIRWWLKFPKPYLPLEWTYLSKACKLNWNLIFSWLVI